MLRFPRFTRITSRSAQLASRSISTTAFEGNAALSELSLVVRAGSRDEPAPGVAHVLQKFAFNDTKARSGLRLQREAELLGGQFKTSLGKENLVLTAQFLREDLPYFVEALADTVSTPLYRDYQFVEEVVPLVQAEAELARKNPVYLATEAAYETAFRKGLANSVFASKTSPVSLDAVKEFGSQIFNESDVSLFARNVVESDLQEFSGKFFQNLPKKSASANTTRTATQFFSGESRIKANGKNAAVLAFPAAADASASLEVLKYVLGGNNIKWSRSYGLLNVLGDVHVSHAAHSDASLFIVSAHGSTPEKLSERLFSVAKELKQVAEKVDQELVSKAVASAKFAAAENYGTLASVLEKEIDLSKVTPESVSAAAKKLLSGNRVLSVVGSTQKLPHLDELL